MSQSRAVSNLLHTLTIDQIDEEFELPVFQKRLKVKREEPISERTVKPSKQSFKRFMLEESHV